MTSFSQSAPSRVLSSTLGRRLRSLPWAVQWIAIALIAWPVVARLLPRGLPAGVVLLGLVFGAFYGLIAVGLVLTYRANRIVNFAQADVGVVAGIMTIELVVHWGWNYFAAVAAGIVMSLALGAVINLLVVRRFRKAPRLILTVGTIGIQQILVGLSLLIPILITQKIGDNRTFATPFSGQFRLWPVVFTGNHLVAIATVLAIMLGIGAFLRWSPYGIAIRAAAENGERAVLLGVPIARLDVIVWSLSALLSFVAVILRVPVLGFNSFSSVSGGGNALLLRTLAAAVIGRMDNLPRTVLAALGIGVFESAAAWSSSNTTIVDTTLVAIIVIALLAQKKVFARMADSALSGFKAIREVRPIPAELRHLPEVKWGMRAGGALLLLAALAVPHVLSTGRVYLASLVLIYAVVGMSLLILTGWSGQISLGQFALAGFGGATTAVLYERHGWDYLLATLAGMAVAALVALIIGLPALRISGPFLAVTTLAFAVSASEYFLDPHYLPWFVTPTMSRPHIFGRISLDSDTQMYYFCLVVLLGVLAGVRRLRHSRAGRALIATRDNAPMAEAAKLDTTRVRLGAFVISGAIAGLAGSLFVVHENGVYTNSFSADISVVLFSMVVIGGLGSMPGVLLGALYVFGTQYFLSGGYSFLASGAGILLLLLFFPEGLGGLAYRLRDTWLRRVAANRGLVVPSLLADVRVPDQTAYPESPLETGAAAGAAK